MPDRVYGVYQWRCINDCNPDADQCDGPRTRDEARHSWRDCGWWKRMRNAPGPIGDDE